MNQNVERYKQELIETGLEIAEKFDNENLEEGRSLFDTTIKKYCIFVSTENLSEDERFQVREILSMIVSGIKPVRLNRY